VADNQAVRDAFVIGQNRKIALIIVYSMSTGRNFDEVLRVINSLQLTARHKVATPVNWRLGEDVIIAPCVGRRCQKGISARLEGAEATSGSCRSPLIRNLNDCNVPHSSKAVRHGERTLHCVAIQDNA
jgi:hypothetical protein